MSNRGSRGLSNPYEHVSGMVRYLPVVSGYHRFRRIAMWSRSIRPVEHVRAGLVKRPSIPTERFIIPDEQCSRPTGVFCLFHGCVPIWITGITAKATFRPVDNKQSCFFIWCSPLRLHFEDHRDICLRYNLCCLFLN